MPRHSADITVRVSFTREPVGEETEVAADAIGKSLKGLTAVHGSAVTGFVKRTRVDVFNAEVVGWNAEPRTDIDKIHVLPSGTELSVSAALGDLERAREALRDFGDEGLVSDVDHVIELVRVVA